MTLSAISHGVREGFAIAQAKVHQGATSQPMLLGQRESRRSVRSVLAEECFRRTWMAEVAPAKIQSSPAAPLTWAVDQKSLKLHTLPMSKA